MSLLLLDPTHFPSATRPWIPSSYPTCHPLPTAMVTVVLTSLSGFDFFSPRLCRLLPGTLFCIHLLTPHPAQLKAEGLPSRFWRALACCHYSWAKGKRPDCELYHPPLSASIPTSFRILSSCCDFLCFFFFFSVSNLAFFHAILQRGVASGLLATDSVTSAHTILCSPGLMVWIGNPP